MYMNRNYKLYVRKPISFKKQIFFSYFVILSIPQLSVLKVLQLDWIWVFDIYRIEFEWLTYIGLNLSHWHI